MVGFVLELLVLIYLRMVFSDCCVCLLLIEFNLFGLMNSILIEFVRTPLNNFNKNSLLIRMSPGKTTSM